MSHSDVDTHPQSVAVQPAAGSPIEQYTVVARRYRPQTFAELVGQEHIAQALVNAIGTQRVGHAYLFTGARGVGKWNLEVKARNGKLEVRSWKLGVGSWNFLVPGARTWSAATSASAVSLLSRAGTPYGWLGISDTLSRK